LAKATRRHEGAGRHAARKRDEYDLAAPADEGKTIEAVVAAHVIVPELRREFFDAVDINVVVARHDRYVIGTSDCFEPAPGPRIFAGQREINEIAGHRDMADGSRLQIARDRVQHVRPVDVFALALPIDETEGALARKLDALRRERQMQVGEMSECEHRAP